MESHHRRADSLHSLLILLLEGKFKINNTLKYKIKLYHSSLTKYEFNNVH